ncbi:hypothetical protein [Spartinivicinus ruber]|uniref:hypothetical protein n=1 Tax=Spartinivicinus ruber TaxID=2683272 RepID=UPI0013D03E48|nr:hypothetical protein [Spartinivicinus ruber]
MTLVDILKSKFSNVSVHEINQDAHQVEVVFGKSITVTVSQIGDRFSASYPELVRDSRNGYKIQDGFAKDMLIDGIFWILNQVKEKGRVEPEIID